MTAPSARTARHDPAMTPPAPPSPLVQSLLYSLLVASATLPWPPAHAQSALTPRERAEQERDARKREADDERRKRLAAEEELRKLKEKFNQQPSAQPPRVQAQPAAVASQPAAPVPPVAGRYRKLEPLLQVAGCSACGEMSVIEAGEFEMGSPASEPQRDKDEGPVRKVKVGRFEIGRTAVTQGQWKAVMGNNPSFFSACGDACPVEIVSWNDITGPRGFLAKLKEKTGVSYRLASEAEREYATRAGTKTAFWWGDTITPEQANYDGNSVYSGGGGKGKYRKTTVRADAFEPNAWGLYNVHGNVNEWVQDCWHDNYTKAPETGVAWETDCKHAYGVLRGGTWDDGPWLLRSATRRWTTRDFSHHHVGFRLARTP